MCTLTRGLFVLTMTMGDVIPTRNFVLSHHDWDANEILVILVFLFPSQILLSQLTRISSQIQQLPLVPTLGVGTYPLHVRFGAVEIKSNRPIRAFPLILD